MRRLLPVLALAALLTALLAGGFWFHRYQERRMKRDAERELKALAESKVDQILLWRKERLADASVMAESPFFARSASRWMTNGDSRTKSRLLSFFQSLHEHYDYSDVMLVDPNGAIRISLSGESGSLSPEVTGVLREAFAARRSILGPLHEGPDGAQIETVAPLFLRTETEPAPVGAVVLRNHAREFLYPLIQSWPTSSESAESLLVRPQNGGVLFLNELRHGDDTALQLRFPLDRTDLPAVMAVTGEEGVVLGVDYRGVPVLAALKRVPDSPWFMVAKVDESEALAVWRERSSLIVLAMLGLMIATTIGAALLWQTSSRARYRELYREEAARRASEVRYRTTLNSVGDAVIATDVNGRVEFMNPVAEQLTGWDEADAGGRPLEEVFRIINEHTRRTVETPVDRVLREGLVVGLANSTVLISRDGTERPIADSGAPIFDEEERIRGVVLVFRDVTEQNMAEREVCHREHLLRKVLDILPIGLWLADAEGKLIEGNPAGVEIWGAEPHVGQDQYEVFKAWHLPSGEPVSSEDWALARTVNRGETVIDEMLEIETFDGRRRVILNYTAPVLDDDGNVEAAIVVNQDITERIAAENQLKEQLHLQKAMMDAIPAPMYYKGMDGVYLGYNPAFAKFFGIEHPDSVPKTAYDLDPGQADWYRERDIELFANPGVQVYESRLRNAEGETRDVVFHKSTFQDASGEIAGLVGVMMDVTDLTRAEQARRASEERFHHVFDAMTSGVAVLKVSDDGERYIFKELNPAGARIAMVDPAEIIGKDVEEAFSTVRDFGIVEKLREAWSTGRAQHIPPREYSDGQITRWMEIYVFRVSAREIAAVFEDVTERRQVEEQLRHAQKMEAIGRLAGGVAHDFRNQLTVIKGYSEMLLAGENLDEAVQDKLQEIHKASERSAKLAGQLLAFGRKQALHTKDIDLRLVVRDVGKNIPRLLGEDVQLRLNLPDEPCVARVDPDQLHQAVINLAINARDAMPWGGELEIGAQTVEADQGFLAGHPEIKPGRYATLFVADTGHGMDDSTVAKLFEPFFTTKEVGKGTGLGLPMVYGFVTQSGGTIDVETDVGIGSRFTLYFPACKDGERTAEPETVRRNRTPDRDTGILLVEDESAVRGMLAQVLRNAGYRVHEASSLGSAMQSLRTKSQDVDLLITDVVMPRGSGVELAQRVRGEQPDMPVLFLSGYGRDALDEPGTELHNTAVLTKPCSHEQLLDTVREMLRSGGV